MSVGKLSQILHPSKSDGLKLTDIPNYCDDFLEKSQWVGMFNYDEPVSIVAWWNTIYDLDTDSKNGKITRYDNTNFIYGSGDFQIDKINNMGVLISDVSADRLDEIIKSVYDL